MYSDVKIRVAKSQDAEELLSIYAPYIKTTAITFEYEVPSVEEFSKRIENVLKKYPYLVAEEDGEILGYAYASNFHNRAAYNWAVETSVYVKMDKKRMGIGSKLYQALEQILKKQGILNLNACIAFPQEEDEYLTKNSIIFHERLGYQLVGEFHKCGYKFNRWYGIVWMEKHIGQHIQNQSEVKVFEEMKSCINEIFDAPGRIPSEI